jgi:hypothetical protein
MRKPLCHWIMASSAALLAPPTLAINMMAFSRHVPTAHAEEPARSTLVGIFESCGNTTNLDDNCVLQRLERVAREEDNTTALAITADYEKALETGNFDTPECQTQTHLQANRIIGHCLLLLNFYVLQSNDQESSVNKFETCLHGGMLGLTYQGNIVAQYFMEQLFEQKGIPSAAQTWKHAIAARRDSNEYDLLKKCYH